MRNFYPYLILAFLTPLFTNAQSTLWQRNYLDAAGILTVDGMLVEKDNSFLSLNGRVLYEDSYFLELDRRLVLPFSGSTLYGNYIHVDFQKEADKDYYLTIRKEANDEGNIYIHLLDLDGNLLGSEFIIEDNIVNDGIKGPAAITLEDQSTVLFGQDFFNKFNTSSSGAINVEWTMPASYGLIAAAAINESGFVLCSENGNLVQIDEDGNEIWVKNLGSRLYEVIALEDGILLAAQVDGQKALIKTNLEGEVLWEESFGSGMALSVDLTRDEGYIFTGKQANDLVFATKTDQNGVEQWTQEYTAGMGTQIIRSQYGGYILQAREQFESKVLRLDEDGNTGMVKDNFSTQLSINRLSAPTTIGMTPWNNSQDKMTLSLNGQDIPLVQAIQNTASGINADGEIFQFINVSTGATKFGPIGTAAEDLPAWEKTWLVNKSAVIQMRQDFEDGVMDDPIPIDLLTYPGTGNPFFNYLRTTEAEVPADMAPFIDVNNDGIYNVFDGDYPDMKGDEMIWWIFATNVEANLDESLLPFEVRSVMYAYECQEEPILQNAIFYESTFINYSEETINDTYFASFFNFDIGCPSNDYVGTMASTNSVYSYNANEVDQTGDCNDQFFPVGSIPLQSATQLNNEQVNTLYYDNNSAEYFLPFYAYGLPFYNFLNGIWSDGLPVIPEGSGYLPNAMGTPTSIVFPGDPSDPDAWSMCSASILPAAYTIMSSTAPRTLNPGDEVQIHLGLLTHENIDYPCPDLTNVESEVLQLQALYDNGNLDYTLYLGPDVELNQGEMITLDAGSGAAAYEWSTGATTAAIDVSEIGTYAVTVTTVTGCTYTDEIRVDGITSTRELSHELPEVYPNPTSGQLFVELFAEVPAKITLENTLGQVVQSFPISAGAANTTIELPLHASATGMYLLRFHYSNNQQTLLRKLIIIK